MQTKKIKVEIPKKLLPIFTTPKRYIVLSGGRGSGKSWAVAIYLILEALKSKKRILCTREIQKTIKDSVYKLLKDLIIKLGFEEFFLILRDEIKCKLTGSEFIFFGLRHNVNEIKSTEGIDLAWVEEAQSVSKESLEVLIPTIRKEGSKIIFTFNRETENDAVWVEFVKTKRDDVLHIHTTYKDNPFLPDVLKKEAEFDKEHDYKKYVHVWLGEPKQEGDDTILERAEVVKAINRGGISDDGAVEWGVDVARYGDDRTAIVKRKGYKMEYYKVLTKKGVNEIVNFLRVVAKKNDIIKVDSTGIGAGVVDYLKEYGYNVVGIDFGGRAKEKDKYENVITEMFFNFKEILDKVSLIEIDGLVDELAGRRYTITSSGRFKVEDKEHFKKRYGRSPDVADAVLLAFYEPKRAKLNVWSV